MDCGVSTLVSFDHFFVRQTLTHAQVASSFPQEESVNICDEFCSNILLGFELLRSV